MIQGLNNLSIGKTPGSGAPAAGGAGAGSTGASSFADTLKQSINDVSKLQQDASQAVTDLATNLDTDSAKLPTITAPTVSVSGLVADASTADVIINVGSQAGVKVGDKLAVSRVVRVVKDPTTGKPLRSIEDPVGQLTITSVDASSAVGSFSGAGKPKTGDTVKTP